MNKIAVYGGGIIAMLLAIALKAQKREVVIWRPIFNTPQGPNRRVFALNQAAVHFLQQLGVALDATTSVEHMLIWDEHTGASVHFHSADVGGFYLTKMVDETHIWQQLWNKVQQLSIPVVELGNHEIYQDDHGLWHGGTDEAAFVCIADGAHSGMREKLKVPCAYDSYDQIALVADVNVTRGDGNTAYQVFGPHGPLAFLPLPQRHGYSIVWSLDTSIAKHYLSLSLSELKIKLAQATDNALGDIVSIESLRSYPLHMLHAKQYYGKNWLLVGDSAHYFHPLAGLGLNMGIGDVACLTRLLADTSSIAKSLGPYQRERKATLTPVIMGMKLIKNCFGIQQPFWVKFRSKGMDWLDHQLLLKKMMLKIIQDI